MILLEIDIDEFTAQEWFTYAGYHIRDAREPLRTTMHDVIWPAIREQLDSQGGRSGRAYDPLSEEYGEWKELHYPGQPILRLTGDMDRALFAPNSYRATRDSLRYRPQSDYAHYHQEGGYVEGRPPQRVIIELIPEDYHKMEGIFQSWLDELRFSNTRRPNTTGDSSGIPDVNILGL